MLFLIGTVKYCLAMPHYLDECLTSVTKGLPELLRVPATSKKTPLNYLLECYCLLVTDA